MRMIPMMMLSVALLAQAAPSEAQVEYVPLQFRTLEGIRPFVTAELNGKSFLFMVHANASFYIQTTHANAAAAGVAYGQGKTNSAIGIDKPGHVSTLGFSMATLKSLKVGDKVSRDVPLAVFEVPMPDMDGMLGIGWMRGNGVIVDYDRQRLGFTATPEDAQTEGARLKREGFVAHAMTWDEKHQRYAIQAVVDGHQALLAVSTVTSNTLDAGFAKRAGFALGPQVYLDAGPTGALVPNHLSKRAVMISIDGQRTAWTQPIVQDTYAYSNRVRSADDATEIDGSLGCEFMLANEAVIDFRSGTLFLRRQPSVEPG